MSTRKCDLSQPPQVGGIWKDLMMPDHAMAAPSRLGCAALVIVLSLGLAACSSSSSSSTSSSSSSKSSSAWYNPVGWFESGEAKGDPAPLDGTAPEVADTPNRPEAKPNAAAQRKDLAQGLLADRDNARYTDEELRGRPAGAPPPPPSTNPRPAPTPSFPTPSAAPRTGVEPAELPPPPTKPQAAVEPATDTTVTAQAAPVAEPSPAEVAEAAARAAPQPQTVAATTVSGETLNALPGVAPIAPAPEMGPGRVAAPVPAAAAVAATPVAAVVPVAMAAPAPAVSAPPPIDAPATNLMQDAFAQALAQAEAGNRAPAGPVAAAPSVPALAGGPSPALAAQVAVAPAAPAAVAGFPPVGTAGPEFPGTGRQTPVAQINFAAGSAKLPANAGASLRRAADAWRQSGGLLRIVGRAAPVEGDRTGRDVMASFSLAMSRAEAVGRELTRIGVSPAALQIDGQGGDPGARDAATEIILEN